MCSIPCLLHTLASISCRRSFWRRVSAGALERARQGIALFLVYATIAGTMPVRADELAATPGATGKGEVRTSETAGRSGSRLSLDKTPAGRSGALSANGALEAHTPDEVLMASAGLRPAIPGGFYPSGTNYSVSPILECVVNGGGGNYTAWFGYQNSNSGTVSIPVGNSNGFSPAPQNRGQVTSFLAGKHDYAFNVAFNGSNLTWSLTGPDNKNHTVTASSSSGKCVPVAKAGSAQTVHVGSTVHLDGTGSSDPVGLPLTYTWSFTSKPSGSTATLTGATTSKPTFVADKSGSYTVQLIVNNGQANSSPSTVCITSQYATPVANAGPAQTVYVGATVQLNGTGSYDPGGLPLTYAWSFVSKPSGSTATLSSTTSATPTFVADKAGTYKVQLLVCNGHNTSAASTVTITSQYGTPIANAGPAQTVAVGATVQLDGTASYDPGGLSLTYAWSITSKPSGSTATLSSSTNSRPTFVADKAGTYTVQLIVSNGHNSSAASTVTITAQNSTPIANAGPPQTVFVGATVQLNGSGSSDPQGHALTYAWTFVSRPAGSTATINAATTVAPTFVADKAGAYTVQLIVNNGTTSSAPSTVVITSQYSTPIANAGPPQTVYVGTTVQLDGTASTDPAGLPLTYAWSFISVPTGSTAVLSSSTASKPTFTADKAGVYKAQLIVNNGHNSSTASTVTITSQNQPPVANAGPPQTVFEQTTVHLDGTGSYDPAGLPLTYQWSFASVPSGSNASLTGATTPTPTFVADKGGAYVVQLIVNNGVYSSPASTVTITTQNSPPVANAGPNQSVPVHTTVQLDGSASTDVDGDPLTYAWSFVSVPAGSHAALANPNTVNPTFVIDVKGNYVVQLIVNDGFADSSASTVTISTVNTAPVANAGPDQSLTVTATIQLDGSASTDVDGDALTYSWSFVSIPSGSHAVLSDPHAVNPTFMVDVLGMYVVQLIVNDGTANSAADTVVINSGDVPPIANPGPAQSVSVGSVVTLDGSASSDSDNQPLTYQWALLSRPANSTATLSQSTSAQPFFTADFAGNYVVQLIVNDGYLDSSPATVTISTVNTAPIADPGPNQTVVAGATVQLSGAASSDADGDSLTYSWAILSQPPAGGNAVLSNPAIVNPTFIPNVAGTYVVQLIVNDGSVNSQPATVTITATPANQAPVVNAGPNQSITLPQNTVTLNGSATDDGLPNNTLTTAWSVVSGPGMVTFTSPDMAVTQATFSSAGTYVLQLKADDSLLSSTATTTVMVSSPANQPPIVNAGPNQTITLPTNTVTLSGTATDDGLPSNTLTTTWSVVSGPGTVTFTSPNTPGTQATFSTSGTYILKLTANDSQLSSSSAVTITVNPAPSNQAPVVSAGPNQAITLPTTSLTLNGTATDDGQPNGTLAISWTEISGPTTVSFTSPSAAVTQATFNTAGTYVLQLSASDSQYTSTSQVTVFVYTSGNGQNQPPYVNAGPDQSIILPAAAQLNGVAVDDGLPSGILTVQWTQVSGPGTVTFANPTSAITSATFPLAGTYVLQLAATDTVLSSTSTVTIAVGKLSGHASNSGTDFWLMFPYIYQDAGTPELIITSDVNNSGTITIPGLSFTQNFTLIAGQATTITLPTPAIVTTSDMVENRGIHVTSQSEITVYAIDYEQYATDGYLGLPTTVLGTDYVVPAWPQYFGQSEISVLAPYDATTVTITPAVTAGGRAIGQPYTVVLNQGRTYQLLTNLQGGQDDLTGTVVTSDKPIAVWGANACANVPTSAAFCNHVVEEIPPTNLWGQSFVTFPLFGRPKGDLFRILPAGDNTNVNLNGDPLATLDRGQFYETILTSASTITSDKPVLVVQYETSESFQDPNNPVGDPSMIVVPPYEQYGGHYTVATPTIGFDTDYVNVVVPTAAVSTVQLDGSAVAASTFSPIASSSYSGGSVQISPGTHHFTAAAPFGVTLYAYFPYDTFGYQAGMVLDTARPGTSVSMIPTNVTQLTGTQLCAVASVLDPYGMPVGGIGVGFSVVGANASSQTVDTPSTGQATYCYTGTISGVDTITASVGLASATSTITWSATAPNRAPAVYAGPNFTINLPASAHLYGAVSDDGLPNGGNVSLSWTQVSGPGSVTFSDPSAAITTAIFSAAGTYDLRLTANDSQLTASSDVTVVAVTPPPNQAPVVTAGPDQSTILPAKTVTLNGSVSDDGLPAGAILTSQWSQVSGPTGATLSNPGSPLTQVSFTNPGTYVFKLTGDDSQLNASATVNVNVTPLNRPPVVSCNSLSTLTLPVNSATLTCSVTDDGYPQGAAVTQQWAQVTGPAVVTFSNPTQGATQVTFPVAGNYQIQINASDTQLQNFVNFYVTVYPANQAPQVSVNPSFQQITLPANTVTLTGTATDDGQPSGSTLTETWTQTLGPATATIASPNQLSTQVTFPTAGNYYFLLTATDGQLSATYQAVVVVNPANKAPIVYAGPNQTASLPNATLTLSGIVTDDGLPSGAAVTKTWSEVSGPAAVTFGSPSNPVTTATFTAAGTYVLRLSANDTLLTGTADVTITIFAAAQNQPPVVGAGVNQAANVGALIFVNGTVTDDGLPTGSHVTINWTQLSGPGTATIYYPNSPGTYFTLPALGVYVMQLSANDTQYTSTATVTLTAVAQVNQTPSVYAGAYSNITLPTNTLNLTGTVSDDGLPGNTIVSSWTQVAGPAPVTFATPNQISTQVTFPVAGSYQLRLFASDTQLTSYGDTYIIVNPIDQAPMVTFNPGYIPVYFPTNTASLSATINSNASNLTYSWTQYQGPGPITFSTPNAATTDATFPVVGTYTLQFFVSDGNLTGSAFLTVGVFPAPPAKPQVALLTPQDGQEVTEPLNVIGSVLTNRDSNQGTGRTVWTLDYSLNTDDGASTQNWVHLITPSQNVPINNQSLGVLDPTVLLNGSYTLRLSVTDSYGQSATTYSTFTVSKNMKVANFRLTYTDLTVPVAGLPITVTRTYDSLDSGFHDFGTSWSLGIANVRVEKNRNLGKNWIQTSSGGGFSSYCLKSVNNVILTITFPDNRQYKFQAVATPQCRSIVPMDSTTVGFVELPGSPGTAGATLLAADGGQVLLAGDIPGNADLIDYNALPYNPTAFVLTTREGLTYTIDQKLGVTSMHDASGNSLTINASGIVSSTGKSISFTRDSSNRITQITDPNGNILKYAYNGSGVNSQLYQFTDGANNTTTYGYTQNYITGQPYLQYIYDARGIRPITQYYDANGRLYQTIDANGKTINYNVNLSAQTETITDRLGNPAIYAYDGDGNITSVTDALGNTTTYTYDANDNKLTETNALGKTTSYTYDGSGNRTSETDPLGHKTTYTYNSRGQVLTVTDPQGHTTTNVYDQNGNLTSTTDANGKTTSSIYGANGLPTSITDANNKTTQFAYDGSGNLTQQTDALNNVTTFTYDANNNKLSQTVTRTVNGQPQSLTTSYNYDADNRLTKTTYPDGTTTQVQYNSIGKQSLTIDQLNRQTSYTYDSMGRLTTTTYPDNTTESATFDAENDRLTSTDRAGHTTTYSYDSDRRLSKTTFADTSFTKTNYDAAGRVSSTVDANNNTTTYAYDDAGRRTSITDALNHVTTFTYDAAGNQTAVQDARQNTTQYQYDTLNRQVKVTYPDLTFSSTAYDALGRVASKTDQAGKVTAFGYDSIGRLTTVTQDASSGGLNLVTTYGYDEVGNRISQTDANHHTTTYQYDKNGRRTGRTLPLGQSETYTYDAAGNLKTKTDFNGKTTTYAYDSSNRLLSKTPDASFNAPAVTFTYTANGLRATMNDISGATTYSYDTRNRLTSKQAPAGTLNYTYDAAGDLLTLASSNTNGASLSYTYDSLNRLSTVTDNRLVAQGSTSGLTTYNYDAVGNLSNFSYPNNVTSAYTYDALNRLTQMGAARNSTSIANYAYTLGAAGNRTNVSELSGRTVAYVYDPLYRLTTETVSSDPGNNNGAVGYTYDSVGNRLTLSSTLPSLPGGMSYSYDANDRLSSDTYDNDGNTISSAGTSNTYDFENHLVQHGFVTIVYDGDGNRVSETAAGVTTKYLVDTQNPTGYAQVVDELVGSAVTRTYAYGLERISENQQISSTWTPSFYGYDGHGSVRQLTSASGTVTDTYDYDAFGNLIHQTGSTPNVYLFAGEQYDPALGLYYNRARYLNTATGRFWTADTFEGNSADPLSLHHYLYAASNPANHVDPTGHDFDIGSLAVSMAVMSVLAGGFGALTGAIDTYLGGGNALQVADAASNGAINGLKFGALLPIPVLGAAVTGGFLGLTLVGAVKATLDNNYKLATFRALMFVAGSISVIRAGLPNGQNGSNAGDVAVENLLKAADEATQAEGAGSGPAYGTRVHSTFAEIVDRWGDPNFRTEVSYLNGQEVPYGTKGSVRCDVVYGPPEGPWAVYDLKTGSATLSLGRVAEIQSQLPGGSGVPVIELKPGGPQ